MGVDNLWFKLETSNPSGSYKDRFVAAEVTRMLDDGTRACVATSSGNTGSALAAYCARYGIECFIIANQHAPAGKVVQMRAHGARVTRVRDFAVRAEVTAGVYETLETLSREMALPLIVSAYRFCPIGMAGVEAIGEEIRMQLGTAPDHVFVPVGGGGLYCALARGLEGSATRIHVVQPEGCQTVVAAWKSGDDRIRPVESTTRISGLAVPFDIDAGSALAALRGCGGVGLAVKDVEVLEAQRRCLEQEGIYCEPAGAAALAGFLHALDNGVIGKCDSVVCLVTGHGFKDPESVELAASRHPIATLDAHVLRDLLRKELSAVWES